MQFGGPQKLYGGKNARGTKYTQKEYRIAGGVRPDVTLQNFGAHEHFVHPKQHKKKAYENYIDWLKQHASPSSISKTVCGPSNHPVEGVLKNEIYKSVANLQTQWFLSTQFRWIAFFVPLGHRANQTLIQVATGAGAGSNATEPGAFANAAAMVLHSTNDRVGRAGKCTAMHVKAYPVDAINTVKGNVYVQRCNRRQGLANSSLSFDNMADNMNNMLSFPLSKVQEEGGIEFIWLLDTIIDTEMIAYSAGTATGGDDNEFGAGAITNTNATYPWLMMWFDSLDATAANWKFEVTVTGDVLETQIGGAGAHTGKQTGQQAAPHGWENNYNTFAANIRTMPADCHYSKQTHAHINRARDSTTMEVVEEGEKAIGKVANVVTRERKIYQKKGVLGVVNDGLHYLSGSRPSSSRGRQPSRSTSRYASTYSSNKKGKKRAKARKQKSLAIQRFLR